ncbi:5389_t:CDS:2, partial [Gigaspora rosea]
DRMTNKDQKPNNGTVSQSEDNNSSYDNSKDTKSANSETDVSKQNLEYVGDNNNPSSDQNLDSNTSNDDFNNSSYDEHDSSTFDKDKHEDHKKEEALNIVEKSATPEKCKEIDIDKYTVDNKVKEIVYKLQKDEGSIELDNSIRGNDILISIGILVAVIAIFIFYYESIFEIFLSPVDSPIFRNLINTTNLLSRQLAELNMP